MGLVRRVAAAPKTSLTTSLDQAEIVRTSTAILAGVRLRCRRVMRSGNGWQKGGLQGRSARSRPLSAQRATLVSVHALARRSRAAPHTRYDDVFERSLHQSHTLLSSLGSSIYPRPWQGTEMLLCSALGGRRRCECCAGSGDRAGLPEHQRLGTASSSDGGGGSSGSSSDRSPHATQSDSPQAAGGLHTVSPAAAAAQSAQHLRDDAVAAIRSSGRSVPTSLAAVSVSGSNDASFDEFDASVSGGGLGAGAGEDTEPELSEPEVRLRLKRAGDLLRMVHVMAPADPGDYNRALIIWCATLCLRLLALATVHKANRQPQLHRGRFVGPALMHQPDVSVQWNAASARHEPPVLGLGPVAPHPQYLLPPSVQASNQRRA